jgi:transmembrane sensor
MARMCCRSIPLRAHRISGAFAAKDPEGFARAVAMSYGLRVEHEGGAIRILPLP